MADPPILRHQRAFNRATRESWEAFGPHRERVMRLLLARPGGRLLVVGAGNCNDLDLCFLTAHFDEIHLADLDERAVVDGVARQRPRAGVVRVLGGIDVTGVVAHLDRCWDRAPDAAAVKALVEAARTATSPIDGSFDVVLSACVLSQLIDAVVQSVGADNPDTRRAVTAVRDRHVEMLLELTTPGGRVALVTDMLSSERVPELSEVSSTQLPAYFEECIAANRSFVGTNPAQLESLIGSRARSIERTAPWIWQIGRLDLLVYGLAIDVHPAAR